MLCGDVLVYKQHDFLHECCIYSSVYLPLNMLTSALAILLPLLVPALALPTPEGQETRVIQWGHDSKMCLQPRVIVKGSEVIM